MLGSGGGGVDCGFLVGLGYEWIWFVQVFWLFWWDLGLALWVGRLGRWRAVRVLFVAFEIEFVYCA